MKFYSREKQPKVWSIAIIAVSTIVIGMVMWLIGGDAWGGHISLLIDIALVAIAVILFIAFRKQLEYDPYSYNTIYYIGFALLVCSMILTNVWLTVMMYRSGVEYQIQNIHLIVAVNIAGDDRTGNYFRRTRKGLAVLVIKASVLDDCFRKVAQETVVELYALTEADYRAVLRAGGIEV